MSTQNKGPNKFEELKKLEKLYTQSKQSSQKNKKFKEFDLSYKDFEQYTNLVSKQKVLDEKKFYHNIEIGQAHKNEVQNDSSDEEPQAQQSLFDEEEKERYEENDDSTQAGSLLQEYYVESNNSEFFVPDYNDQYNINLKQQRFAYYSLVGLSGFFVLVNFVQFIDSLLKVDPKDTQEYSMKYYSSYFRFLEFSSAVFLVYQIANKMKDLVNKKRIRYANTNFSKEKLLCKVYIIVEICLQILIQILNSEKSKEDEETIVEDSAQNEYSMFKICIVRLSNLFILIALYFIMVRIEGLQQYLMLNILRKPLEEIPSHQQNEEENEGILFF